MIRIGVQTETESASPGPVPLGRGGLAVEEAAVPVEPGTQTIEVDLQVTWLLR